MNERRSARERRVPVDGEAATRSLNNSVSVVHGRLPWTSVTGPGDSRPRFGSDLDSAGPRQPMRGAPPMRLTSATDA